ncbi:MAG: hydantoinase B/oxoprolinase family protein [Deltaproteobacteria bacterium]|nr:hydantoinase B/oxoprolinase family protein [Deltaproteobacteria bacterium]
MSGAVDPIVLELVNSKVTSIVEEMRVVLFHSGYSTVLRESEDGSAGLLDAELRTLAVSKKLPFHFASFSAVMDHLPKYFLAEELEEGDALLFNHPFEGNVTHTSDTVILMPIFYEGKIVGYSGTLAHKPDLGGIRGLTAARDLWEEGLVLPPVKFYSRGAVNRDIERIVGANSRIPGETLGDLRGQVAACQVGARRLRELCARFGAPTVTAAGRELMNKVAERLRNSLRAMPDGTHEAEGILDHDNVDFKRMLRAHLKITKTGDKIVFDFTGSDAQAQGAVNLAMPMVKNSCYCAVMALTDPNLIFNHGFVEAIEFRFREGTMVCPRPGAAVSHYTPLAHLVCDMAVKALGEFAPERAAASAGGGGSIRLMGTGADGKSWVLMELLNTAQGATNGRDGVNLIHGPLGAGQFRPGPIEIHESEFPLRITRFSVTPDSGGPGKYRGGMGSTREYQALINAVVPVRSLKGSMRGKLPPWGIFGGGSAQVGDVFVNNVQVADGVREVFLKPGDVVRVQTNAGGGFGDPFERDPQLVLRDVLDRYVTIEHARADYGVVIDLMRLVVDVEATRKLRATRENSEKWGVRSKETGRGGFSP